MNENELYRKEICISCANNNCTNKIQIIKKLELLDKQMKTTTTIKCNDFIKYEGGKNGSGHRKKYSSSRK